jgi:hypothetical protein
MSTTDLVGPLVRTFPPANGDPYPSRPEIRVEYPQVALPFCWGRSGTYVHRVRYTTRYYGLRHHNPDHPVASTWCGSSGDGLVAAEPPDDRLMCGTCHGRAIGAGQIDTEGTPLIFTPRTSISLGPCVYLVGSRSPYWGGYSPCHRQAIEPIPEVPGAGVCGEHAKRWPPAHRWRRRDNIEHAREQVARRASKITRSAFDLLSMADDLDLDFWSTPPPAAQRFEPLDDLPDIDPEDFWT